MSPTVQTAPHLHRRQLLRGGAVAAGALGATAFSPQAPASAAASSHPPVLQPTGPRRLLDTRDAGAQIAATPTDALDAAGRLRGGRYLDVLVGPADASLLGVYLTVHAVGAAGPGHLVVYAGGPVPNASSLDFQAARAACNSTLSGVQALPGGVGVRVWTSATTHVALDLVGLSPAPRP